MDAPDLADRTARVAATIRNMDRRVLTIRCDRELHDALLIEADRHRVSMNALCIALLNEGLEILQLLASPDVRAGSEQTNPLISNRT